MIEHYALVSGALIASTFFYRRRWLWLLPAGLIALQLWWAMLAPVGAVFLSAYIVVTLGMARASIPRWAIVSLRALWFLMSTALVVHLVPGIYNLPLLMDASLKPGSAPTSLYWNIDKVWLAWSLGTYVVSLWQGNRKLHRRDWGLVIFVGVVGTVVVMLWGMGAGVLAWQPAVPMAFILLVAANLLNTCIAEELLFRGVIQRWCTRRWSPVIALFLTSALFGLVHLPVSLAFAIGAFIAGLCYGAVYQITGRLWAAVLCHWGLNLVHMLLFTYPVVAEFSH
ncbi:MAG TPA: CPBP family intramembrane glutamic endopeptidase [Cellvibrionaceae bacterium]